MKDLKINSTYSYQKAIAILEKKGIRPTSQRKILAKLILKRILIQKKLKKVLFQILLIN